LLVKKNIIVFVVNVDWFFVSHRLPIAIEALKNGYEVHLICKITSFGDFIKSKGIIIHDWNIKRSSFNIFSIFLDGLILFLLFKKIKPSLIHAITIKPIIFAGLIKNLIKNTPIVYSISGLGYVFISQSFKAYLVKRLVKNIFKFIFKKENQHIIFQNIDDQKLLNSITKLTPKNSTIIPGSGVDLNYFKPSNNKKDNQKPYQILFAARLLKSKGILEFIEVAKQIKNVDFLVAGKFDKENLDCITKKDLHIPIKNKYIKFLGFKESMLEIIQGSSIVVLPSYYGEGVPKILIEAAACGKPIITTDHPGCRDAVINGLTGFLVEPRDVESLKNAIEYLISKPELMYSMGLESRNLAIEKFNINNVIVTHLKIYNLYINSA